MRFYISTYIYGQPIIATHIYVFYGSSAITKPSIKIPNNLISKIKFKEKHKMSNKDLFKEAIADAKAVREAALANAKIALEEAFTPKLQSMLAAKLQEMETEEEKAENLEEVDLVKKLDHVNDFGRRQYIDASAMSEGEEELEEDFDLSEILAELSENDDKDADDVYEAKDEETEEPGEDEEPMEDETSEDEPTEEPGEEETAIEGDKVTDLTVDELRDIIKDIITAELEAEEMETPADEEAEMNDDEMSMDMDNMGGEDDANLEEIDLEELLAELDAMDSDDKEDESMYEAKKSKKEKEEKEDMKEAIDTINTLRNELNEVNLLNAKLLYVNKIFKAKNLNESQKLKVIAQFDKATTAQEAKTIFESMNNAIVKSTKSTIKESLGFASKAAGNAPQKQIVEVNETVSRWQMLAGIK